MVTIIKVEPKSGKYVGKIFQYNKTKQKQKMKLNRDVISYLKITKLIWHSEFRRDTIRLISSVISTAVYGLTAPILPSATDAGCR